MTLKLTLKLDRVNCYHGGAHVLRDVSLEVAAGEVLGLLGRNGAGKTTTLRTVMGLVRLRSGSITLDATNLLRVSRVVGSSGSDHPGGGRVMRLQSTSLTVRRWGRARRWAPRTWGSSSKTWGTASRMWAATSQQAGDPLRQGDGQ